MMKTIQHSAARIFVLAFVLCLLAAQAWAAVPSVSDEAGLLSAGERKSLEASVRAAEQTHRVRIAVWTSADLKGIRAGEAANRLVDRLKADSGTEHGAIALVLDMARRDWYIATDTEMRGRITDGAGIDYLSGVFVPKLSDGAFAEAFQAYVETAGEMLAYYEREGAPYDPANAFSMAALGIALVLAAGVFFLVRAVLVGSMHNVMRAAEADAYLDAGSFDLRESRDTFLYMTVSRRAKPKKSESASRDSGHGGGGGKF